MALPILMQLTVAITLDRFRTDEVAVVWRAEEPSPDEIVPSMEPE
jgi:hypothetical protein